jgi:serine/threonine protein kinase
MPSHLHLKRAILTAKLKRNQFPISQQPIMLTMKKQQQHQSHQQQSQQNGGDNIMKDHPYEREEVTCLDGDGDREISEEKSYEVESCSVGDDASDSEEEEEEDVFHSISDGREEEEEAHYNRDIHNEDTPIEEIWDRKHANIVDEQEEEFQLETKKRKESTASYYSSSPSISTTSMTTTSSRSWSSPKISGSEGERTDDDNDEEEEEDNDRNDDDEEGNAEVEDEDGDSDKESTVTIDEEDSKDYKVGGYHPVKLGDIFNERYCIVEKLGWGHFSTVWLAWDVIGRRWTALKIVKSAEVYTETACDEIALLSRVAECPSHSKGKPWIVRLYDHFIHEGPNGKHVCMVMELLGHHLLQLIRQYRYKGIPSHLVKHWSKRVLQALDCLHRECSIIHTDLKPENVLLCLTADEWASFYRRHAMTVATLECDREGRIGQLGHSPMETGQTSLSSTLATAKTKTTTTTTAMAATATMTAVTKSTTTAVATSTAAATTTIAAGTDTDKMIRQGEDKENNHFDWNSMYIRVGPKETLDGPISSEYDRKQRVQEQFWYEQYILPFKKEIRRTCLEQRQQQQSSLPQHQHQQDIDADVAYDEKEEEHRRNQEITSLSITYTRESSTDTVTQGPLYTMQTLSELTLGEKTIENRDSTNMDHEDDSLLDNQKGKSIIIPDLVDAKIADLGNACWIHRHFTDDIQTRQYRSPEVILGATYDQTTDMWSMACMVFELLTGDFLFDPSDGDNYDRNEDHLALIIELLGSCPGHLIRKSRYGRSYFTSQSDLRHIKKLKFWSLSDVLQQKYHYSMEEAQQLSSFLLPMLEFDPKQRRHAHKCIKNPWLKRSSD